MIKGAVIAIEQTQIGHLIVGQKIVQRARVHFRANVGWNIRLKISTTTRCVDVLHIVDPDFSPHTFFNNNSVSVPDTLIQTGYIDAKTECIVCIITVSDVGPQLSSVELIGILSTGRPHQ